MATYTTKDLLSASDAAVREWRKRNGKLGIVSFLRKQAVVLGISVGSATDTFVREAKSLVETQLAMIKLAEATQTRMSKDGIMESKPVFLPGDLIRGVRIPDYTRNLTYPVSNIRAAAFERIESRSTSRRYRRSKPKKR